MISPTLIPLMAFYGFFLIVCGIVSVVFIGMKAKTALLSGGFSGGIALMIAYLLSVNIVEAKVASLLVPLALFIVFAWRSTKTLLKVFELIPARHEDLNGKGIAFLIISLMAIVSIFVFIFQVTVY